MTGVLLQHKARSTILEYMTVQETVMNKHTYGLAGAVNDNITCTGVTTEITELDYSTRFSSNESGSVM